LVLLQQIELKTKTDRIRRSIPDWVRQGLLPPLQFRPLNTAAAPGAQSLSSPVLISSAVRADLGFLGVMTEAPRPRSLFRDDSGPIYGPVAKSIGEQLEPACVAGAGPVRPVTGEEVEVDMSPESDAHGSGERRETLEETTPWSFALLRFVRSLGACVWDVLARWCGGTEARRGASRFESGGGASS
jgi:hypothetical protein